MRLAMRVLVIVLPALLTLACGSSAKRSHDMLRSIRSFNEGLRWYKLTQSASRIPPDQRDDFLDERESLEGELHIDNYQIMRLETEGELQGQAKVQIKWTWYMDREGIVKKTTSLQHWKRYGASWMMLSDTYLRGDDMPGLAEDPEDADDKIEDPGDEDDAINNTMDAGSSAPPKAGI